jgi:hypothetical protein
MPCDESVLGFSNRWYRPGIANSIRYQLPSGRQILIFSTPYLLASKIEAFTGRGGGNFYFSADIEDIVAVLDGRSNLIEEVQQADTEVKLFLSRWFRVELENLCEIGPAFLSPVAITSGRASLLLQTIERLAMLVDC